MKQTHEPIVTEIGTIAGRDAIFLDDVIFNYKHRRLELRGDINSNLCSELVDGEGGLVGYSIIFLGVWSFRMTELEMSGFSEPWSFFRVAGSKWIGELIRNSGESHVSTRLEHLAIATYDDVFDIACESFALTLLQGRSK